MFKIAGELTPAVIHVAARAVATHALSIFGDHSDVMAARSTGWAMLASTSVQEAQDLAAVAHAATLRTRVPFLHFFDGFRTSHEVADIEPLDRRRPARADRPTTDVAAHRARGLTPDRPMLRGTAQNPDVVLPGPRGRQPLLRGRPRPSCTGSWTASRSAPAATTASSSTPATPRPSACWCSWARAPAPAARPSPSSPRRGERVGVLIVRLFRPFPTEHLLAALPPTTAPPRRARPHQRARRAGGAALPRRRLRAPRPAPGAAMPRVVGGRYGLASKEFTPAMRQARFAALAAEEPPRRFTLGIVDDVTHLSVPADPSYRAFRPSRATSPRSSTAWAATAPSAPTRPP